MSKSIWDVRFNNSDVAQDADDEGQWITMHGAHVMIDDKGTIIAGANGKFNGKTVAEVKREQKLKKWGQELHKVQLDKMTNNELSKEYNKNNRRIKELGDSKDGANLKRFYEDRNKKIEDELSNRKIAETVTQRLSSQFKKNDPANMSDEQIKNEISKAEKKSDEAWEKWWNGSEHGRQENDASKKQKAIMQAWRERKSDLEDEQDARHYETGKNLFWARTTSSPDLAKEIAESKSYLKDIKETKEYGPRYQAAVRQEIAELKEEQARRKK